MKKTISLALVFSFIFALALQLPALAIDTATSTEATDSNSEVPMLTSTNPASTSTPEVNHESSVEATTTEMTEVATTTVEMPKTETTPPASNLEKIPTPEYIKYFREVRKVGDSLFGIRKSAAEIERIKQENTQVNKPENRATSTEGLEKISSPEHISLFEKIIKIGKDLFGVKKENASATSTLTAKAAGLEKIVSLSDVKFFEQIKKIGNDLFGIRKKGAYVLPTMTSDQITCVSAAIDTKDSKISEALTMATAEINSAISARGICQKAALSVNTERQVALNACNKTFMEAQKKASDKTKNTQKEVWMVYNSSLKTCSSGTAEIKIEDGGQNVTENLK